MSERHKCRVILLVANECEILIPKTVKTYQCNVLHNNDIRKVMEKIQQDFGCDTIDILIENGKSIEFTKHLHCKEFIEFTSQNIMSTINVSSSH